MRVLITGGAGVLRQKLAELGAENGDRVRIFDLPQVDYSYFDDKQRIEIVKGDIRDKDTVKRAVAGVDAILHLAALIPPASERSREFTMAINVGGAAPMLESASRYFDALHPHLFGRNLWGHDRRRTAGEGVSSANGPGHLCRKQDPERADYEDFRLALYHFSYCADFRP